MAYREGQRLKGSDGNIYVVRNGQPVLEPTALTGADPTTGARIAKAQNEAIASGYDPRKAQTDLEIAQLNARIKEAEAAVAQAQNDTQLKIAQANLEKTRAEIAQINAGKGKSMNALQMQLDRVGQLYRENIQGGLPNPLWGRVPTSTNNQFNSAAQGIYNPFMATFRIQGQGSQSDADLKQFLEANTPTPHDTDLEIEEKMRNIQTRIDAEKGVNPDAPPPPQSDQVGLAKGGTRSEVDPALKATAAKIGAMLANGTPGTTIEKFLRDSGVDPASTDLAAKLKYRVSPEFKRWQRANPGAPYPIDPSFYTKQIPMSALRQNVNEVAQSPFGAFNAAAANAVSGGRLDNMVGAMGGDQAMAQTGMELLRTNNPKMSFAGDVAGQAMAEATLGRIPGAHALMATRWGRRGADALYGAYSGSGENDGDPLSGALTGAATNAGFGMLGRSAQRGVGRTMTGVKNQALQYLDDRGVPLTIGQIGRGSDNVVGRTIGGLEERAMGLPGFDAVIGKARQRGDKGFNSAAFKDLAGHTGSTGAQGIIEGDGLVDQAYDFLNNATIPLDAQYAGSQAGVRAALPAIPRFGPEIDASLNMMDKAAAGGAMSGRGWQNSLRLAKGSQASIKGEAFADPAHELLGDVQDNLVDLAARQGPPNAVDKLIAANKLYTQMKTISGALDNGPAQKAGELFSAGRLDDAARTNTRKYGGQVASLSGYRPFYDLTTAGKEVMPNLTPDSGTAGRVLLAPLLAAGGGGAIAATFGGGDARDRAENGGIGAGYGAALGLLGAGVYSKPAQQAIQKALLGDRNPAVERLGQYLITRAKLAGLIGSGIGRDYVYQPELPNN